MQQSILNLLTALLVTSSVVNCSNSQKENGDKRFTELLQRRIDELQSTIDTLKRDHLKTDRNANESGTETDEPGTSIGKRFTKWRDPKRPMFHDSGYKQKKSLLADNEHALENKKTDDLLVRLLVRALMQNEHEDDKSGQMTSH